MNALVGLQLALIKRGQFSALSLSDKQTSALEVLMDNQTKTLYYGGGAGGGKSWLGCEWLFTMSQLYPGTRWFIGREELKRIRQSTLITWSKFCKTKGFDDYSINGQDNFIRLGNGSQIDLLDLRYLPRDPLYERYGSIEFTGGWIEEAGEVHFDAYDTLTSRVGRHLNKELGLLGKILITLNPKKNWCYKEGYKPWRAGELPKPTKFIQALVHDNPKIDPEYITNLENIKDKSKKERLLHGNWEYDDDPDWLIESFDAVTDLFTNKVELGGSRFITCDAARMGSDKAITVVWDDWAPIDFAVFDKSKTTDISNCIKGFQTRYRIPNRQTIVDADGVGGGVTDEVQCVGFVNNARPVPRKGNDNYGNLQDQCGFLLADRINESIFSLAHINLSEKQKEEITEELEQLKRMPDTDGKERLLKKKVIKQNIGRSPDWRDVFLMRSFFDLTATKKKQGLRTINC